MHLELHCLAGVSIAAVQQNKPQGAHQRVQTGLLHQKMVFQDEKAAIPTAAALLSSTAVRSLLKVKCHFVAPFWSQRISHEKAAILTSESTYKLRFIHHRVQCTCV